MIEAMNTPTHSPTRHWSRSPIFQTISLLVIVLSAAFLRLYRLHELPPGDGYDPAYYGIDALYILQGERPIFLPTNFGREVLYSYLTALSVSLLGVGPLAVHVVAALLGVLTVPVLYLLGRELFREDEEPLRTYAGLLAALLLAISYWHLHWSRYGVRAIMTPLFAGLIFYLLFRALRRDRLWDYALTGLVLGLSAYTYQASRILPLVVVVIFGGSWLHRRRFTQRDGMAFLLVSGLAVLVFAPLGLYFLTHPGSFSERINQTWALDPSQGLVPLLTTLSRQISNIFLTLSVYGDDRPIVNLPGRPLLNGVLSLFLYAGMLVSLWRVRKPPYLLLWSWFVILCIPGLLAEGDTNKRIIGALPAVILFVTVGLLVPAVWLARLLQRGKKWAGRMGLVWAGVVAGVLIYTGGVVYRDYFVVWAQDPDLFTHFETGLAEIGRYAATLPPEEPVFISPEPADHPSIVYNSQLRPNMRSYNGRECLPAPQITETDTTYIVIWDALHDGRSLDRLARYFPDGGVVAEGPLHYGQPYFRAFRIPAGSVSTMTPANPADANWSDQIHLAGFDLSANTATPGETLFFTLYYEALTQMDVTYTVFTQLLGPARPGDGNPVWGQQDREPCGWSFPTTQWRPGERIQDDFALSIAPDAAPGEYTLLMGFYQWPSLERLRLVDENGVPQGDSYRLTPIAIQ